MDQNDKIKSYFNGFSRIKIAKNYKNFLKENIEIELYLNDILTKYPEYESILYVLQSIIFNDNLKSCKECGKIYNIGFSF